MDNPITEKSAASQISGNASDKTKTLIAKFSPSHRGKTTFGAFIWPRIRVVEISFLDNPEEFSRKEARVVCHLKVEDDMLNGMSNLHGGCSSFLVDIYSGLSFTAYILETTDRLNFTVSQAINTVYHSPAGLGDELKIVNTTVSMGKRALTARTEIWNETHHRLVASGTQIAMFPSPHKSNL